jgi:hypothetical protein
MAKKCHFSNILIYLLSMCLNHIIAHETYHYYLALPVKLAPTCFPKQHGTSKKTQEFDCRFLFFVPPTTRFEIWGLVIYGWFPTVYYTPPLVLTLQLQKEKEKYVVV